MRCVPALPLLQVWFDTPPSLRPKYRLASELGLRGVGFWSLGSLEHGTTDPLVAAEVADMWGALRTFTGAGPVAAAAAGAAGADAATANNRAAAGGAEGWRPTKRQGGRSKS